MRFEAVERVADAVMYEGYVLYPYRASAQKNRFRWQFGVLAPRSPAADAGEPWFAQTECLVEAGPRSRLFARVRFLRPAMAPSVDGAADAPGWLDGVPHAIDMGPFRLDPPPLAFDVALTAGEIRLRAAISVMAAGPFAKLRVRLENLEPWREEFAASRNAMLLRSLVGTHLLLGVDEGAFVSLVEPPAAAASAAATCENRHTWPVLAGANGDRSLLLSSPIVLSDYPAVAAESPGDLCDAAEIDEILSLRILAMTDAEKREARATDPRAASIIDRVEGLTAEAMASLHGAVRNADFFNPADTAPPDEAFVVVGGSEIRKGSHVRLRPARRADAMDLFLRDQAATVAGVYRDVDDHVHVAVTVDADPAADLHESIGRFFYFDPMELEPIPTEDTE